MNRITHSSRFVKKKSGADSNEKFSKIFLQHRKNAEEKEKSKSQNVMLKKVFIKIYVEKGHRFIPAWHNAPWKDKLKLLDKFDDERMRSFGKKIIYQETDVLPKDILTQ